jgi:hypothetical protein
MHRRTVTFWKDIASVPLHTKPSCLPSPQSLQPLCSRGRSQGPSNIPPMSLSNSEHQIGDNAYPKLLTCAGVVFSMGPHLPCSLHNFLLVSFCSKVFAHCACVLFNSLNHSDSLCFSTAHILFSQIYRLENTGQWKENPDSSPGFAFQLPV